MSRTRRATFTFVRHGESTDNLRAVWAGWADATLSRHGMNQAQAVGAALATTRFNTIYSSPLKRAALTAQAIQSQQQATSPPHLMTPLLREQHFGVAEGQPSTGKRDPNIPLSEQYSRKIFPHSMSRSERFPEGESLDDVHERAGEAWTEVLLPYAQEQARAGNEHVHIAVVSHGIFIKEALRALANYDRHADISACDFQWLRNTAWARVVLDMEIIEQEDESTLSSPNVTRVELTHFNQCDHLNTVTRQKGGIGREAYDARQKDIRGFFGAGSSSKRRGLDK